MKKIIAVFILFITIITAFSFVYLKISANGREENYFNAKWREKFSKIYFFRQTIGLHYDGDARSDYLGGKNEEIIIEIDSMKEGFKIEAGQLDEFAEKIKKVTGKKVSYFYSDNDLPFNSASNYEDLARLEKEYREKKKRKKSNLYLLVASSLKDNPMRLGSTLKEDGVVLFSSALADLMNGNQARNRTQVFNGIIIGTLLHEFGHQLGLPHNNKPDCLMNEQAEYSDYMKTKNVITDFCEYEKESIKLLSR